MANKTAKKATQTKKAGTTQESASSPRTNNDGKAEQEKIDKGLDVINELKNYFFFDTNGNYLKVETECDNIKMSIKNFLDDVTDGKTNINFSVADFAPYHIFLFHDTSKKEMCNIFFSFLRDCFHKKAQSKPYEVLRYENFLKGMDFLQMALKYPSLDRTCYTFDPIYENAKYQAQYALMELSEAGNNYFKEFSYIIDDYKINAKAITIRENFKNKISRLAEIYQLSFKGTEKGGNVLAGKITKHLGIKEAEADD